MWGVTKFLSGHSEQEAVTKMKKEKSNLDVALKLRDCLLCPIPIEENGILPLVPWERYYANWPSKDEIREWFSRWPNSNIAVLTGTFFGVFVIELERGHDHWPPQGCDLKSSVLVATHRGTLHCYYRLGRGIRNSYGELARGVNVLEMQGYTIIPPSKVFGIPYFYIWGSLINGPANPPPLCIDHVLKKLMRKQINRTSVDGSGVIIPRRKRAKKRDAHPPRLKQHPLIEPPKTDDGAA